MLINPAVSSRQLVCWLRSGRVSSMSAALWVTVRQTLQNMCGQLWADCLSTLSTLDISNQTKKTLQGDSAEERRPKSHFQNNDRNSHIQPSITIKHRSSLQTFTRMNPLCYRLLPDPFWLNLIQHQSLCITGMVWSSSWSSRLETKRSMMAQAVTYHQCDLATFDLRLLQGCLLTLRAH